MPLPCRASACAAVSGDNWVLRFGAHRSSYFLIRVLYCIVEDAKLVVSSVWN